MMVVMIIPAIVVIVIAVRAAMMMAATMMVMMPPTVMVMTSIADICAGSPRMSAMGHHRTHVRNALRTENKQLCRRDDSFLITPATAP